MHDCLDGCAGISREVALKKSFWDLFGVDGSVDQVPFNFTQILSTAAQKCSEYC